MTAVANTTFTAAQFNTHVRDNLNETAPAKATAAGGYFVATGVNSIAQRIAQGDTELSSGSTSSTSYADLDAPATMGPSVTVTTGPMALVIISGRFSNSTAGLANMAYDVSGATSLAAADDRGVGIVLDADPAITAGNSVLHSGGTSLTPGVNTFTAKYRVSAGTGTFSLRRIAVLPL